MKPILKIVIPAYNEAHRLPSTLKTLTEASSLGHFPWDLREVIVVNDGSADATSDRIGESRRSDPRIHEIRFRKNMGKGAAVFAGLDHATRSQGIQQCWILVADADEATPWTELFPLSDAVAERAGVFLFLGSRRHKLSRIEHRQEWWRERLGRLFNLLLRFLSAIPFKDTQCGFKLFQNGEKLELILNRWTVARFAWDAEVIMNALSENFECVEQPIAWRHVDESKVHPLRDGLQMAREILRIRFCSLLTRLLNKSTSGREKQFSAMRISVNNNKIQ